MARATSNATMKSNALCDMEAPLRDAKRLSEMLDLLLGMGGETVGGCGPEVQNLAMGVLARRLRDDIASAVMLFDHAFHNAYAANAER